MNTINTVDFDISGTGRYNFEQSNLCMLNSSAGCKHALTYGTQTLCNHHLPINSDSLPCKVIINLITTASLEEVAA